MTRRERDDPLLEAVLGPLAEQLRSVSLPLHILLEGRFGELNDNQLEMIHAAQDAARAADGTLRKLERIRRMEAAPAADSQRTADLVRPTDLLRAPLLTASASAERRGALISAELGPELPYVVVDRAEIEEALTLLLGAAVDAAEAGEHLRVEAMVQGDRLIVWVRRGIDDRGQLDLRLARLLVEASGGEVQTDASRTTLYLVRAAL